MAAIKLGCRECGHTFVDENALLQHGRRAHDNTAVQIVVMCPYCDKRAKFLPSSAPLYQGRDYGPAWACSGCEAWVGCHKGSNRPLGRLADRQLRRAKVAAHGAFDTVWKNHGVDRGEAYRLLAERMGLSKAETHIGMFNVEQCQTVVAVAPEIIAALVAQRKGKAA